MRFAAALGALFAAALASAATPAHERGAVVRTVEGRRTEITVERQGAQRLIRRCSEGVCEGSWTDGRHRWTFGVNEVLVPDDDRAAAAADDGLAGAVLRDARAAPGLLAPPAGPRTSFSGQGTLTLADATVPIVPCELAARRARCLLDTGSTPSAISLALSERLGLEPHGELEIAAFGTFATGVVETGPLALGAATFDRVRLAVAPNTARVPFDVLIGADLLARVHVVLDRQRATARIDAAGGESDAGTRIALTFRGGVPFVPVTIAGGTHEALLDTGDASLLSFGYDAYRAGPEFPVVGRTGAAGIAGAEDALIVKLPSVSIGPLALGAAEASVRRTQHGVHAGIGLWSRCVVELDESQRRAACAPR